MTMTKHNPFLGLNLMGWDMDRFMHRAHQEAFPAATERRGFQPPVDIIEDNESIYFDIEIPGVLKDEVKISVSDDNILKITGEKKFIENNAIKTCCRNERNFGVFSRAFRLPENVDPEKIEASHKHGVLKIRIPKISPVKPEEREVQID